MSHTPPPARGSSVIPLALTPDDAPTIITRPADGAPGPAIGERVGPYEILGVAGTGGMASVLRAKDVDLGREVALKMLPPAQSGDTEAVARFKLEGRAAAQLDHDNVARVFACGEDAGRPFIAFEFVEGETLRDVIARQGPLTPADCVAITAEVAAGLAHAAERGIVHRDIKPSNLIVTPGGRVKIVDMGLARCDTRPVIGDVTKSGVTLGTFDYISPEQALDPRRADPRSDIYSLGCTVYHAATGRPPVPSGTAAQKLHAHQHLPVVDPRVYNPAVPPGLAQLLATMMAKSPARRFQTPKELLAATSKLAAELGVPSETLPLDARGTSPAPQSGTGRGGLLAGLAAVAAAVVVAVGLVAPTHPPGPTAPPWEVQPRTAADVPPAIIGERPKPPAPGPQTVGTIEELAKAIGSTDISVIRLTGRLYDLTALPDGLLVGGRPSFTLEAAEGASPTLRVAAAPPAEFERWGKARSGALTVAGVGAVTLRGLRFDVADGPASDGIDRPAGVVVAESDTLTVENCRVEAVGAPPDTIGLLVTRGDGAATVTVRKTLFNRRLGGGLALMGPVKTTLTGCAFAPLPAAVRLSGAGGSLSLTGCKFLLDRGAAVEFEADASWTLEAGGCVFAAPPVDPTVATAIMMGDGPPRPVVVRAASGWPAGAKFTARSGEPNLYHATDALVGPGPAQSVETARLRNGPFQDTADDRKSPPWASRDPLADLDGADPWRAFRVGPPVSEAASRVKVWWPEAGADPPRHTYTRLDEAVKALRPGDELHIRHDGELPLLPVVWNRPGRLLVRPYPGTQPVLVPTRGVAGESAAVVRLLDGEVLLDGLTVRLTTRVGAAVAVGGGRRVTLKGCTVTVDDPGAAAVRLLSGAGETAVTLTDTLVRGWGLGVAGGDRSAEITLNNSWAALGGPLVRADGEIRVTLTRVTAAVIGPLLDSRIAGRLSVSADRCVFAPLGGRLQLTPTGESRRVEWTTIGPCWFADTGVSIADIGPMATAHLVTFQSSPAADNPAAVERADLAVVSPELPAGGIGADPARDR